MIVLWTLHLHCSLLTLFFLLLSCIQHLWNCLCTFVVSGTLCSPAWPRRFCCSVENVFNLYWFVPWSLSPWCPSNIIVNCWNFALSERSSLLAFAFKVSPPMSIQEVFCLQVTQNQTFYLQMSVWCACTSPGDRTPHSQWSLWGVLPTGRPNWDIWCVRAVSTHSTEILLPKFCKFNRTLFVFS